MKKILFCINLTMFILISSSPLLAQPQPIVVNPDDEQVFLLRQQQALKNNLPAYDGNPALMYWQAIYGFNKLPEETRNRFTKFSDEHKNITGKTTIGELTALFGDKQFDGIIQKIERGAFSKTSCDWGVDYALGLSAELPFLAPIRQGAALVSWHARYEFMCKEEEKAIHDLMTVFRLVRHLGEDGKGVYISLMVQKLIEHNSIELAAMMVPSLNPASQRILLSELNALIPGMSPCDAVISEKAGIISAMKIIGENYRDKKANSKKIDDMFSKEKWVVNYLSDPISIASMSARYDAIFDIFNLPYSIQQRVAEQYQQERENAKLLFLENLKQLLTKTKEKLSVKEQQKLKEDNGINWALENIPGFANDFKKLVMAQDGVTLVIENKCFPDLKKIVQTSITTDSLFAMLRAGIILQIYGLDIPLIPDPFTTKPYIYQNEKNGFTLQSELIIKKDNQPAKPVSLRFGEN